MARRPTRPRGQPSDYPWYKDAIIYEIHVRAFSDSDGDGVGDIRGLIERLDYLDDLGVTALWLLPFYPSPLKDDGYDISDFTSILPVYGTMNDFRDLVDEAHHRGIHIVTELVINHTSDQHPWFQRARKAPPKSKLRDYYVWSDNIDRYKDARVIFKDYEHSNWTWDTEARTYYWHRFYSHQPDLNYDNPLVQRAIMRVMDFWLRMGVDGLRIDAVPYLFEREGTSSENLPETHQFLKHLRRHVDQKFPNRMLLAEANQWPEDAIAYFGDGDECHMAFHFPLMPRMFMAIRMEDRFPIVDILQQTPSIPDPCQWAVFLRNHDELTLEMVTDEERDYMYRVYAQDPVSRINLGIRRRLAPLLNNDRKKIELMNALLFSLPGTPVIYYGDEIGMGDNFYLGDRNGVRTPMQWSPDRNAGFSRTNPQRLYLPPIIDPEYHYEAINVENQQKNTDSLLWWMKRLIVLRKRFKAFGHGSLSFVNSDNRKVLAYIRRFGDEIILVAANLAHTPQQAQVDLSEFVGRTPVELFGRAEFSSIGDSHYSLTLGAHGFYWFSLEPETAASLRERAAPSEAPVAVPTVAWKEEYLTDRQEWHNIEGIFLNYISGRRWFRGKARPIQSTGIEDVVPMNMASSQAYLVLFGVHYTGGESEIYVVPVFVSSAKEADPMVSQYPQALIANLQTETGDKGDSVLLDGFYDEGFSLGLLEAIGKRRRFKGEEGQVSALSGRFLKALRGVPQDPLKPSPVKAEQSNTSVMFGDRLILKLFRRVEAGPNPEAEIGRFLTDKAGFKNMAPFAGELRYKRANSQPMNVAVLSGLIPNEGDAWQYTLDSLGQFFTVAMAHPTVQVPPIPVRTPLALGDDIPQLAKETIGPYLSSIQLLAKRTAELHVTLASAEKEAAFVPEPFSVMHQNSLYHSMRALTVRNFELLRAKLPDLPEHTRGKVREVLNLETEIIERYRLLRSRRLYATRIRCHGDYHLGQVLYTGKDFVIIDFEGEPARPLSERRLKRCSLRDVAGMVRSFDYAAHSAVLRYPPSTIGEESVLILEQWARFWYVWVSAVFLSSYLAQVKQAKLLPEDPDALTILLDAYLLDKAVYEIGYELNNRPDWLPVPLRGIMRLLRP